MDFRSLAVSNEQSWTAWNDSLSSLAVGASPRVQDAAFDGAIRTRTAASGLSFTLLDSRVPQRLSASPGMVDDVFWLALVLSGGSILNLGAGPVVMSPGDILYGKRGVSAVSEQNTEFRMLLVNIPGALLTRKVLLPLPNKAIYLSGRSAAGHIFSVLLKAVADSLDELDDVLIGSVEAALPQLLLSNLFGEDGEIPIGGAVAVRANVLQRICQSIELNLGDPDLTLSQVATDNGVSARYLQKLFEAVGGSFSSFVRRRRLEQCRLDLANPLNADVSITTTCFHWGFNDAATFSRAFREEFGMTPRDYRKRCRAGASSSRS